MSVYSSPSSLSLASITRSSTLYFLWYFFFEKKKSHTIGRIKIFFFGRICYKPQVEILLSLKSSHQFDCWLDELSRAERGWFTCFAVFVTMLGEEKKTSKAAMARDELCMLII